MEANKRRKLGGKIGIFVILAVLAGGTVSPNYGYAEPLRVTAEIPLSAAARDQRLSPDGSKLYVLDGSTVTIINTATNSVSGTINSSASRMTFSPGGDRAYLARSDGVDVVDPTTEVIITSIPTGWSFCRWHGTGIEYAGNGKLYAAYDDCRAHAQRVFEIDPSTNSITQIFTVGNTLAGFSVASDGLFVYAVSNNENNLYVCDTTNGTVSTVKLTFGSLGRPQDMIISNDDSRVYVANAGVGEYCCVRTLDIVETSTHTLLTTVSYSNQTGRVLAISPDDTRIMAGGDRVVEFVDLVTETSEGAFGSTYVTDVYVSADGTIGLAGAEKLKLQVFDLTGPPVLEQEFDFQSEGAERESCRGIEESSSGDRFYVLASELVVVLEVTEQGPDNTTPVACIVGEERVVEAEEDCVAQVVLDGSCSSDADSTAGTNDDINDFDWYEVIDACEPNSDIYLGSGEVIECNLGLGEHVIVLEVTDNAGAFDSNEAVITVEDAAAPVITLNGADMAVLECGVDSYTEEGATASDNCDDDVLVVIGGDTVDTSTCGTYEVTYDAADDSCNTAEQVTRTVIVDDTMGPVIALNGADTIVLECGVDSYVEEGATATDNCEDDVAVAIGGDVVDTSACGTYVITYDATDSWGNEAEQVVRTVVVEDTEPPEFSVVVEPNVLWPPNGKMVAVRPEWEVSDNCDEEVEVSLIGITMSTAGDINDYVETGDDGSIYLRARKSKSISGRVYTLTYQAVDNSGNVTEASTTAAVRHRKGPKKLSGKSLSRLRGRLQRRLYRGGR